MFLQIDKNPDRRLETPEDYIKIAKETHESAVEFSQVVEICFPSLLHTPAVYSIAALSSELFMKAIIYHELRKQYKGHDLYKIFNSLPINTMQQIRKEVELLDASITNFDLELKEIRKAFEVLRYSHEKAGLAFHAKFIVIFMCVLRDYCDNSYNVEETV